MDQSKKKLKKINAEISSQNANVQRSCFWRNFLDLEGLGIT